MDEKKLWLHVTVTGDEVTSFASLKTGNEVRDYFAKFVKTLSYQFEETFEKVYIRMADAEGGEVWCWGEDPAQIDDSEIHHDENERGFIVEVDGKEVFNNWWVEEEDTDEDDAEIDD